MSIVAVGIGVGVSAGWYASGNNTPASTAPVASLGSPETAAATATREAVTENGNRPVRPSNAPIDTTSQESHAGPSVPEPQEPPDVAQSADDDVVTDAKLEEWNLSLAKTGSGIVERETKRLAVKQGFIEEMMQLWRAMRTNANLSLRSPQDRRSLDKHGERITRMYVSTGRLLTSLKQKLSELEQITALDSPYADRHALRLEMLEQWQEDYAVLNIEFQQSTDEFGDYVSRVGQAVVETLKLQ